MKNILLTIALICTVAISVVAEKKDGPVITFDNTTYDFGTIKASDGTVECTFDFTNTGNKPLVVVSVTNGGCGCTTPTYTLEPIQPGDKGYIKIKFNPTGRRGEFNRQVKVRTNADPVRKSLRFTGVIIP